MEVRCRARAAVGSSGGSHPVPPGLLLLARCTVSPLAERAAPPQVRWSPWSGNKPRGPPEAIPTALLDSALPPAEAAREVMQRGLASGWGPWLHSSMLALVSLPSAATVTSQGSADRGVKGVFDPP